MSIDVYTNSGDIITVHIITGIMCDRKTWPMFKHYLTYFLFACCLVCFKNIPCWRHNFCSDQNHKFDFRFKHFTLRFCGSRWVRITIYWVPNHCKPKKLQRELRSFVGSIVPADGLTQSAASPFADTVITKAESRNYTGTAHGPLTRYVKLRVAHAPGMPGTFSPPPTSKETASLRSRHASRHVRDARAMMHVGIANPRWGENDPGIPGACAARNFTFLVRGPWDVRSKCALFDGNSITDHVFKNTSLISLTMLLPPWSGEKCVNRWVEIVIGNHIKFIYG